MTTSSDEVVELLPVAAPATRLVTLAAGVDELIAAQRAYHEAKSALLSADDYVTVDGRQFITRSGWTKLAVAFAVSTELRERIIEREGSRIRRATMTVRAIHPATGRFADGIGVADLFEKCCDPRTCRNLRERHVHCSQPCHAVHFSNPEHDLPATAATRAANRARADLFGLGEVSAEELGSSSDDTTSGAPAAAGAPPQAPRRSERPPPDVTAAREAGVRRRIATMMTALDLAPTAVETWPDDADQLDDLHGAVLDAIADELTTRSIEAAARND